MLVFNPSLTVSATFPGVHGPGALHGTVVRSELQRHSPRRGVSRVPAAFLAAPALACLAQLGLHPDFLSSRSSLA